MTSRPSRLRSILASGSLSWPSGRRKSPAQIVSNSRMLPSGSSTRNCVLPNDCSVGGPSGSMPAVPECLIKRLQVSRPTRCESPSPAPVFPRPEHARRRTFYLCAARAASLIFLTAKTLLHRDQATTARSRCLGYVFPVGQRRNHPVTFCFPAIPLICGDEYSVVMLDRDRVVQGVE